MPPVVRSIRLWLPRMAAFLFLSAPTSAVAVDIDLSGAVTGTLINAPGASFAQTFDGQTVSGIEIVGAPTSPLSLAPAGIIETARWGNRSLLSQPDNSAPLSILLDNTAISFTWSMGYASAGSPLQADFFASDGSLVNSATLIMEEGYTEYSLLGFGAFDGITFHGNTDPSGVRFMQMSYALASGAVIPEPSTALLLAIGLAGLAIRRRHPH
jgi:hypothetical protein